MIKDTSAQDSILPTQRHNRVKRVVLLAVVLIAVALSAHALLYTESAAKSVERASVKIATVERGDLVRDIVATGRIVAAKAPQVYSPEEGLVALLVRAGDAVTKGQEIARVTSPQLQNKLQQEHSELARLEGELARKSLDARRQALLLKKQLDLAKVELKAAERESRRANTSIEDNIISQIDFEKAEDDLARAYLNVAHAEQEVALAADTLAFEVQAAENTLARQQLVVEELQRKVTNLSIRASVDGVVGNLFVIGRSVVTANQPLMTLVDLTAYEAEINVAESVANELGLGMDVELNIGRQTVQGKLSAISPEVTEREVTTRVRFDQAGLTQIRQNQQVTARILLDNRHDVLKVRRGNFLQSGGYMAYKLSGNVATRIDIETGATSMREVEILKGAAPGDEIIVSSYQGFDDVESILLR